MMRIIVQATNDKIAEDFLEKDYSEETLKRSPHIALIDEVPYHLVISNNFVIY
jgi:hypothetical protein